MSKIVFISGATSGIGKSCAFGFAREGFQIIACGRRKERLKQLQLKLKNEFHTECFIVEMDVSNQKSVIDGISQLPEQWKNIDVLVNNAGLALGLSTIDQGDTKDWDTMIDTNVKGLLYVTNAIVPIMKNRKQGHIINIGSIAGKEVYLRGNVYCATKHAVDALTKAMRIDLLPLGIKVTQVAPGAVETEFSLVRLKGDAIAAESVYNGYLPLTPDDVADAVLFCATRPAHVNVNDILIMPTAQASTSIFNKLME